MYWNHRIMRRVENPGKTYEETNLYVVEVYYNNDDGYILGWTEKESVWGESIEEIRNSLTWMMEALDKPILDEVELLQQVSEETISDLSDEESVTFETIEEVIDWLNENDETDGDTESWENEGGNSGN